MNNTKYNPKIHHRRSIRLKGYDYSQAGLYFVTICCLEKLCIFGDVKNGQMILNLYGQIAHEEWQRTEIIRNNCVLHEFIIMPNHIHGIIDILFKKVDHKNDSREIGKFESPSQTIGSIIRGFKIATIKKIKEKISRTGELQFARDSRIETSSGDTKLTPDFPNDTRSGELQFAPTGLTEIIKELNYKIWQRNYYEIIIRNEQSYHNISKYILDNPSKWHQNKSKYK